ncbi:MAG: spermidine synthase [Alphaproteobacteria bacterium ADurb.Bin438]|nr:MAG: spermidine synthase [Alphaproteobacteria bacterium ADurb.Bin438]
MVSIRFVSKENQLDAYFFIFWLIFGYAFVFFKKNIPLLFILFSGCLISANLFIKKSKYELELKGRNFYGTYQVLLEKNDNSYFKMLRHGNIFHGFMDMNSPLSKIGYYSEESPLGSFFKETEVNNKNWDFALIGLGAGASLCYFKDTQSLDIYEIDEEIVKLSTEKNVFPFMRDCKKDAKIIIGDGRVMLANQDKKYDAIIIDAFSSDAIPSHLLTREAFLVYLSKLKEDGLMLFHISNLYIDLEGVIDKAIKGTGIKALVAEGGENESLQKTFSSKWVVLSKADLTNFKEKYGFKELKQNDEIKYFTDDYSSIYKAIKLRFRLKQG